MPFPIHLLKSALQELADPAGKLALKWVESRFTDSSQWTLQAVLRANHRTWCVVGLALVEESRFGWARDLIREGELKAARNAVRDLIDGAPTVRGLSAADLRRRAGAELDQLQRASGSAAAELAGAEAALRRYTDPAELLADADRAACELADAVAADAPHLADVLRLAPDGRPPLFASIYRHFLQATVAKHTELFGRVIQDQLRALAEQTDARTAGILDQFDVLFDALAGIEARLKDMSAKLDKLLDARDVTTNTRDPLKVSVTNERELAQLRQWRDELRTLPPELVDSALLSKLGDALAAARMLAEAREAHEAAARAAKDRATQAESQFKAYRAACEQEAWTDALSALVRAADLDPDRFRPFPFKSYEPVGILGAGGFGTVIRCRQRLAKGREVAVKTFHAADLGREVDEVFAEAHTLSELVHPAIVKILHWELTESTDPRPYLVMEYFPGVSLAAHLKQHGRLSVEDFLAVARPVAEAMVVAHAAGILHRDLKPGNVLVSRSGGYSVRVIDFGLAVRFSAVQASVSTALPHRTRRDQSFAGTLEYASPEQKGMIAAAVGPRSDVYSFGKTMLEALLGTTEPTTRTWKAVPDEYRERLQELLEQCVEKNPADRHDGFTPIVAALAGLKTAGKANREHQEREAARKHQAEQAERARRDEIERTEAERRAREQEAAERERAERVRLAAEAAAQAVEKADRERREREAAAQREREEAARQEALRVQREKDEAERKRVFADEAKRKADEEAKSRLLNPTRVCGEKITFSLGQIKSGGFLGFGAQTSDVAITFAWCPPGSFRMGSDHPEAAKIDWCKNERPVHRVTLTKSFFMGIHPITRGQFARFVAATDYKTEAETGGGGYKWDGKWVLDPACNWRNPGFKQSDQHPVTVVSWNDAQRFVSWLQTVSKRAVRLPTEAEWEYACRAGTTTEYHFGDAIDTDRANYHGNHSWNGSPKGKFRAQTTDVGSFPANPWGLSDMHGNVLEWCADYYGPYQGEDQTDPCQTTKQSNEDLRVLRGGSWRYDPAGCRAACRNGSAPASRSRSFGFRACFRLD